MPANYLRIPALLLCLAGCGSSPTLVRFDLAMAPEPDLRGSSDMTATVDMTVPEDLVVIPDLLPGTDMAKHVPKTLPVLVGMGGSTFNPKSLTILAHDSIEWQWKSSGHNVISGPPLMPDGRFCSPADAGCKGQVPTSNTNTVYTHLFNVPGTYPYYCGPHAASGMVGTIIVQ